MEWKDYNKGNIANVKNFNRRNDMENKFYYINVQNRKEKN